mgnify:CR=1 FL=1
MCFQPLSCCNMMKLMELQQCFVQLSLLSSSEIPGKKIKYNVATKINNYNLNIGRLIMSILEILVTEECFFSVVIIKVSKKSARDKLNI